MKLNAILKNSRIKQKKNNAQKQSDSAVIILRSSVTDGRRQNYSELTEDPSKNIFLGILFRAYAVNRVSTLISKHFSNIIFEQA